MASHTITNAINALHERRNLRIVVQSWDSIQGEAMNSAEGSRENNSIPTD
jgi:hypothetical protein